jgi:tetratricopeptide (TPR) repeat protein
MIKNEFKANRQVLELEQDIRGYDRVIRRHPEDDNAHYLKAEALIKMAEVTGDESYFSKALEYYNKAISLSPQNALYLAARSKLHIKAGNHEDAVTDIIDAQRSPISGNKVLDTHTKHMIKDVIKLDSVQTEVRKLIAAGKVPPELDGIFSSMVQVIGGISARLDDHGKILDSHDEILADQAAELAQLKDQLNKFQVEYPALLKIVGSMSQEISTLQVKVIEHDEDILTIKEHMAKLCSKEEFNELASRFEKVEEEQVLFGGKIKLMQGTLDKHETSIMTINNTLEQSNCYNKGKIREGFEALKTEEPNEVLYHYANHFYWALSNYLLAYRSISSGAVQGVRDKSKLEKIWDKVGSAVINVTRSIPVAGGILALVEEGIVAVNDHYKSFQFERKVAKINELITSYVLEEDLNLAIASASINIALLKRAEIVGKYQPKPLSMQSTLSKLKGPVEKKMDEFEAKIESLLTKVVKVSKVKESPAAKLAVKDVVLFLNYLATNEVKLVTQDTIESLDQVITNVFENNISNTDQALFKAISANLSAVYNNNKDKCIIAVVDDITYDNPLLNHPKLFKAASEHFGMNKAVALSQSLSPELITEAISTQDQDLILAGMISLNLQGDFK